MATSEQVKLAGIGSDAQVEVIEIAVKPGQQVDKDSPLLTVETDKATVEIPSPQAGTVAKLHVKLGDQLQEGALLVTLDTEAAGEQPSTAATKPAAPAPATPPAPGGDADQHAEVLVLGGGPGGYTAAFRAADLGKKVILVERGAQLGGVCLNVGCIPSKALLHAARGIAEAEELAGFGIKFSAPEIDIDKLRARKDRTVTRLTKGLTALARQRKVEVINGEGRFASAHTLAVESDGKTRLISFDQAIVAVGSRPTEIPGIPYDDPRVMDSTGALELADVPKTLLVIGGGIIGLEMATVYRALGAKVTIVELAPGLIPGCDPELVAPLAKHLKKRFEAIHLNTRVSEVKALKSGLKVSFDGDAAPKATTYDRILVAVGRRPNSEGFAAEAAGIAIDKGGFIAVDKQRRSNVPHIYAIGDITGAPMLAHKAVHEGKVAAETAAGEKSAFDPLTIPSVAYTDPEVAWAGLSEAQAKEKGIEIDKAIFPWMASGRALGMGRSEGLTKLVFSREDGRLLGAGIVGPHAGDLISEAMLGIEMGSDAEDLGLTIHPHPTLSETLGLAAEMVTGSITDLYVPRRKK